MTMPDLEYPILNLLFQADPSILQIQLENYQNTQTNLHHIMHIESLIYIGDNTYYSGSLNTYILAICFQDES